MAFTKFVVHNGRIATRETIALDALDERCLTTARDALTRLRTEQSAVPVVVSDKTEVVVGLGVPTLHVPEERLPEAQREAWVAGRLTAERTQRDLAFYVTTSRETGLYCLARQAAVLDSSSPWHLSISDKPLAEMTNLAGVYGAVAATFGREEMRKPVGDRDLGPSPERIQQFWSVATQIIAGAPAFMCAHRLSGVAAAFADCFAIAMLTDSVARTTAA